MSEYEKLMADIGRFKKDFSKCDYYEAASCDGCPMLGDNGCTTTNADVLLEIVGRIDKFLKEKQ